MNLKPILIKRNLLLIVLILLVGVLIWVNLQIPFTAKVPLPSPQVINKQGDTILFENDDFQITYLALTDSYIISIIGSPFAPIRTAAEQKFADLLQKSPADLCVLNATVSTPYFANPEESGISYPLSFCLLLNPHPSLTLKPQLAPLNMTGVHPSRGIAEIGNTSNSVFIDFDQPINVETAVATIEPTIEAVARIHPRSANQLIVVPDTAWTPDTSYKVIIKAGLESKDGKYQLKNDLIIEYQTKSADFSDYPDVE